MARIKKERKGKENAQKCYISHPCSEGPNDAIFTKFGTVVDLNLRNDLCKFGLQSVEGGGGTLRLYKIYLFPMNSMVGLKTGKH